MNFKKPNFMSAAAVHLYPHDTPWEVILNSSAFSYRCTKLVHFLRHAEGHHNVKQDYRSLEHTAWMRG
jgi:hypothetical protein